MALVAASRTLCLVASGAGGQNVGGQAVGGQVQQTGVLSPPTKDDAIALGTGQSLVLGNRLPATRSIGGYLHYAAVYLEALSQAQIDQNVSALLASDDAP